MPSEYVPTGRPRGRPRVPVVEKQGIRDVVSLLKETTVDRATRPMNAYCPDCFPDGFTGRTTVLGCSHGTWVKR